MPWLDLLAEYEHDFVFVGYILGEHSVEDTGVESVEDLGRKGTDVVEVCEAMDQKVTSRELRMSLKALYRDRRLTQLDCVRCRYGVLAL